ncbi:MAG: methyltransferase domain-containing protein [Bacteroidota bacterium]
MSGKRQIKSSYGVINHYLGDKGRDYFAWQGEDGITQALFNKHLWQPFISHDDDILDFGCGGGFLLKVLDGRKKVGIEVNPYACESARKLGIKVYSTISEAGNKFDKIISSHALEHVPHPRQVLMELKEKLRNEKSRLLLLLPLDDWRSGSNKYYNPADQNMHLHTWTPQLLGNLINSCGMRVIDIRLIRHAWPPKNKTLWRISHKVFHMTAFAWSVFKKQRQLFCIASLK